MNQIPDRTYIHTLIVNRVPTPYKSGQFSTDEILYMYSPLFCMFKS